MVTDIVGLIAVFLNVDTFTSFINFGPFSAFTLVTRRGGVPLHAPAPCRAPAEPGVLSGVQMVGAIICPYLHSQLDSNAITLGLSWLAPGIVVLALITRAFKAAPPAMIALNHSRGSRHTRGSPGSHRRLLRMFDQPQR
ncbi:hypothetical protein [Arthrobacter sp. SAFR-014]|uniref:hypothetical protein n=1 Tax=unclassified Arthrobacter TaxID=235627 RepID=UPI003F7C4501